MIKTNSGLLSWVARSLSGLLVANLLFGCGSAPAAAPASTALSPQPATAPADSPLSADLATRDVGQDLFQALEISLNPKQVVDF